MAMVKFHAQIAPRCRFYATEPPLRLRFILAKHRMHANEGRTLANIDPMLSGLKASEVKSSRGDF